MKRSVLKSGRLTWLTWFTGRSKTIISSIAYDSDPLNPQHFGFLDPDPQMYADPRIQIQRSKYQQKLQKNLLLSKPKSELLKKERLSNISSFSIVHLV